VELVNAAHSDVKDYVPIKLSEIDTSKPICDEIERRFKENGMGNIKSLRQR